MFYVLFLFMSGVNIFIFSQDLRSRTESLPLTQSQPLDFASSCWVLDFNVVISRYLAESKGILLELFMFLHLTI
ncbi:hypothetical protein Sbal183_1595 [Shewanella baltica OS183]|nr:hypothetical protein Sbal175_2705 [Shewanella baltica BA175]AEH13498.1 hypothetical protein Sbal117_1746 [Shewanella baltica OS117]EHQ14515.1 hypothetical protein Sbal183_1595 [Shewanella baltica OS183]